MAASGRDHPEGLQDAMLIRERLERAITAKEKAGLDHKDLLAALRINDKQLNQLMGYFAKLDGLEKAVSKL